MCNLSFENYANYLLKLHLKLGVGQNLKVMIHKNLEELKNPISTFLRNWIFIDKIKL
jgi:hypothetical protein